MVTEADRVSFTLEAPTYFNFAEDVIGKWAQDPNKLGLLWSDPAGAEERWTFRQIDEESSRLAHVLTDRGVRRGDRVFIMLGRVPGWWLSMLAVMKAGAVCMPGTTQLTQKDIAYRIESSEARLAITDEANAAKFPPGFTVLIDRSDDLRAAVAAQPAAYESLQMRSAEPCLLYFTSGTTGFPKMALHTHASCPLGHRITGQFWLALGPNDLHWNHADVGWAKAAWSSLFGPWNMGAAVFAQAATPKFDPTLTLETLARYPITSFCSAPTGYRVLVTQDIKHYKFPCLRSCVGAGEPLNPEVIEAWRAATGITIRDGYGQTETVILAGNFPDVPVKFGSMGKPAPTIDLHVIDDAGQVLPPNKEGDVAVRIQPNRPLGLFQEYWRNPGANSASFKGDWYITGDRAYTDEEGYFWFVGRADDVINSSGYRIGPFEVESALIEHEAVVEAAVVAKPDSVRGEIVKAFVVLGAGHVPSDALAIELQEHVKRVTAPYKYPREIEFVPDLPKTVSGKIRRVELRQREVEKAKAGGQP